MKPETIKNRKHITKNTGWKVYPTDIGIMRT